MSGAIQTSIASRDAGFLGGVANSNPTKSKNTVASEDVKVGKFVTDGADGVANIVDADSVIAGVVAKTSTMQEPTIKAGDDVLLLKGGNPFVYCETACTEGDTVYVRHTVNGALEIGDIRADDDTAKAKTVNAKFAQTLTSAGLVEIEVNL